MHHIFSPPRLQGLPPQPLPHRFPAGGLAPLALELPAEHREFPVMVPLGHVAAVRGDEERFVRRVEPLPLPGAGTVEESGVEILVEEAVADAPHGFRLAAHRLPGGDVAPVSVVVRRQQNAGAAQLPPALRSMDSRRSFCRWSRATTRTIVMHALTQRHARTSVKTTRSGH